MLQVVGQTLARDRDRGILLAFEPSRTKIRLVYTAEMLSFQQCEWQLDSSKAEILREHLRLFTDYPLLVDRIQIEGHADTEGVSSCRGLSPYRDNMQLSQNRARAVLNALLGLGPTEAGGFDDLVSGQTGTPPQGLEYLLDMTRSGKLQVAGFGSTVPVSTDARASINRRVEIVIVLRGAGR